MIVKIFNCSVCNTYLGEMSQGKLHKQASILCNKCMEHFKTMESLNNYNKNTTKPEMPEFFKDLFDKKM